VLPPLWNSFSIWYPTVLRHRTVSRSGKLPTYSKLCHHFGTYSPPAAPGCSTTSPFFSVHFQTFCLQADCVSCRQKAINHISFLYVSLFLSLVPAFVEELPLRRHYIISSLCTKSMLCFAPIINFGGSFALLS
jgi:hypothetical protein